MSIMDFFKKKPQPNYKELAERVDILEGTVYFLENQLGNAVAEIERLKRR